MTGANDVGPVTTHKHRGENLKGQNGKF